jgi:hypothetical protein
VARLLKKKTFNGNVKDVKIQLYSNVVYLATNSAFQIYTDGKSFIQTTGLPAGSSRMSYRESLKQTPEGFIDDKSGSGK